MTTKSHPPCVNSQGQSEGGCAPLRRGRWEHEWVTGLAFAFGNLPGRQKNESPLLDHWASVAAPETQALNAPLLPKAQQNCRRDTVIWGICVIIFFQHLLLAEGHPLTSAGILRFGSVGTGWRLSRGAGPRRAQVACSSGEQRFPTTSRGLGFATTACADLLRLYRPHP